MFPKSIWEIALRLPTVPTSPQKHYLCCLENGLQSKNSGRGLGYHAIQIQFQITNGMGRKKVPLESKRGPIEQNSLIVKSKSKKNKK